MIKRSLHALIVLGVVVVLLGVLVGALWWFVHRNSQTEAASTAALQAAREQAATALANEVSAPATDAQGGIDANVIASAVVRADPEQVVVLVFINQTTPRSQSEVVQLSAHRIELTMTRRDGRWLVSDLERV